MHHRMRLGLAAVIAATLVLSGASPAQAGDPDPRPVRPPVTDPGPAPAKPRTELPASTEDLPPGYKSWDAVFTEQARLNAVADRIVAAGGTGYAGLVADPENRDVRLYWKGAVPATVQRAVEAGRATVPVQVIPAAHTEAELTDEAQRWIDSGRVTDAYPKADGSGVVIEVAQAESAGAPQLPDGARTAVTVEYGQSAAVPLSGRQYDTSPYWGGAKYYTDHGGCTFGFAVTDHEGYPGMLSAGHCGQPGEEITTTDGSKKIGRIWSEWDHHDISLIWIYQSVAGRVYTGPADSSSSRSVMQASTNYTGNYVCTNGAASGEHCSVKIYSVSPSHVVIKAKRTKGGGCAVAHGDSGGPVVSENVGAAFGYGIISQGQNSVSTCRGVNGAYVQGYNKVIYKGLQFTLNHFGAKLRTWG